MEALDGCFLDCPIRPLNLTVRPGMIGFHQVMFEKFPNRFPVSLPDQWCDGTFTRPNSGYKEIQLAPGRVAV